MHPTRTTHRRALAAVVAAGITVGTLILPTTVEATTARTESPVVADAAESALAALERWNRSSNPADLAAFRTEFELAATTIANDVGVSPRALLDEWTASDEPKQVAMLAALTQLGVPYRSMTSKEDVGFDCSGLTTWAFREAGVELPRISGDQIRSADAVDLEAAQPGDLAYYPGHVSIYIGQGLMVHSPNSGNRVEVRTLASRTSRFGDAFTDEMVFDEDPLGAPAPAPVATVPEAVTTTVPEAVTTTVPDDGLVPAQPRRFWLRYLY